MSTKKHTTCDHDAISINASKIISSFRDLIHEINAFNLSGMRDFEDYINSSESYLHVNLRLREHPFANLQEIEDTSLLPSFLLSALLEYLHQTTILQNWNFSGLTLRKRANTYDFCISGEISEEKLEGIREYLLKNDHREKRTKSEHHKLNFPSPLGFDDYESLKRCRHESKNK